jgi:hypothetical protein
MRVRAATERARDSVIRGILATREEVGARVKDTRGAGDGSARARARVRGDAARATRAVHAAVSDLWPLFSSLPAERAILRVNVVRLTHARARASTLSVIVPTK